MNQSTCVFLQDICCLVNIHMQVQKIMKYSEIEKVVFLVVVLSVNSREVMHFRGNNKNVVKLLLVRY